MNNHKYKIEFELDVEAVSLGEAIEMAKEAVLLDYASVIVDGEEVDI